jgi:hypothetical protein
MIQCVSGEQPTARPFRFRAGWRLRIRIEADLARRCSKASRNSRASLEDQDGPQASPDSVQSKTEAAVSRKMTNDTTGPRRSASFTFPRY